ncbi:MAG: prepilin-type N-terminal cleavage/methylation domain-containing protein [Xanthomonadales bacterium]|nr:prepilin-type N-terminal cleavage/methylation domain-containing protein [Xanthomonadales bacterium]
MKRFADNKAPSTAGFTLVELLLAITLMSILLALTYSGLRAATRATESGEEKLAVAGGIRASHQFIRKQLNQMLPLAFAELDDVNGTRIVFMGDSRNILFVAPMPGYLGAGGPQVQYLELADGDDGYVLQFRHALLQFFEEDRLYDRDPVVLLEHIEAAEFEFIGRDEEGLLTPWMRVWDQQDTLPVAVRLNIEFAEDIQAEWPVLVAGVRVDEQAVQGTAGQRTYQQAIQDLMKGKGGTQ